MLLDAFQVDDVNVNVIRIELGNSIICESVLFRSPESALNSN